MKILVLATYPIEDPTHGGQLRVRNIVDTYKKLGHKVEVIGVLGSESYPKEHGFHSYPGKAILTTIIDNPFLMEDYSIGELFFKNKEYYQALANSIKIKPDVIHVEQPWLFRFAKLYVEEKKINAKLIYSSQNIEWELKFKILSSYVDLPTAEKYASLVREVEYEIISKADAIICVSEDDKRRIEEIKSDKVYLAPNGVSEFFISDKGYEEASFIKSDYKYALYCASAHPPNMTGFFDILGDGFGSLKPDEKLIIAGGAGLSIKVDARLEKSESLKKRILVSGVVGKDCLASLIEGAHCIILPLTQGGGTNLKTAEAIWSGKHIVATTVAMRGFEDFIGSPGVYIEDDSSAFKRKLREVMEMPPLKINVDEQSKRRRVLWGSTLNKLSCMLRNISEENGFYE